jgi:hypothetical protein
VPVTDLRVHDGDLVASTQGRAFWVLDDIAPLRAIAAPPPQAATLFPPTPSREIRIARGREGAQGQNPPNGTLLYYWLPAGTKPEDVKIEILDPGGTVVNSYSAAAPAPAVAKPAEPSSEAAEEEEEDNPRPGRGAPRPSTRSGLNRFVWDWQSAAIRPYPELKAWRTATGYRVAPGRYQARLTVAGTAQVQPFEVLPDPRVAFAPAQEAEKQALLRAIQGETVELLDAVQAMKAARAGIQSTMAASPAARRAGAALDKRIERWLDLTVEINDKHFVDPSHSSERLDFNLLSVLGMVDNMDPPLTAGLLDRVGDVRKEWQQRRSEYSALSEEAAAFRRKWPAAQTASR